MQISNTMLLLNNCATDACFNHFQGLAASFSQLLTGVILDSTSSLSFSTTSENTPLTGNGLQLGYNFEKFRVSLNSHLWSAGESKLDSQLLLLDYFLPYGLYAGGGFGTAKLDTSIGSASKTAPALHFGYQHNFTNNFSLEAGLLWFGASFSLEKSAAAPEATISNLLSHQTQTRLSPLHWWEVVYSIHSPILNNVSFVGFLYLWICMALIFSAGDRRILVTGTITPTYGAEQSESKTNETPPKLVTKTTHELEAPTSILQSALSGNFAKRNLQVKAVAGTSIPGKWSFLRKRISPYYTLKLQNKYSVSLGSSTRRPFVSKLLFESP